MESVNRLDVRPLVSRIADVLREQIVSGELPPGCRVTQDDVATSLGVSRTPVREAFQLLTAEGWVLARPRAGVEVTSLSAEEVQDIAVMRLLTEPYAAGLNAELHDENAEVRAKILIGHAVPSHHDNAWFDQVEDINRELHFLIYGMGSAVLPGPLESSIQLQWERFARYRRLHWADEPLIRRSQEEHERIIEAWVARDAAATSRAMSAHIIPVAVELVRRIDPAVQWKPSLAHLAADFDVSL